MTDGLLLLVNPSTKYGIELSCLGYYYYYYFYYYYYYYLVWYSIVARRDNVVGSANHYGSRYRIPVGARFSAPVQTGPGAHPASYTIGKGCFSRVKRPGREVTNPPHLAPRLKKE
jgi:hypothetical protein